MRRWVILQAATFVVTSLSQEGLVHSATDTITSIAAAPFTVTVTATSCDLELAVDYHYLLVSSPVVSEAFRQLLLLHPQTRSLY